MSIRRFGTVALIITALAFVLAPMAPLGSRVWPAPFELNPPPTPLQANLFMLLTLMESIALGLAIAFLILGGQAVRNLVGARRGLATAMHLSAFWVLGNWWLHDSLHMIYSLTPTGLLSIEYAFHATLMTAGSILVFGLVSLGMQRGGADREPVLQKAAAAHATH